MFALKHRLWVLVLTCTHNLCFEQKYEKYYNFSSENFNDNGPIRAHLISGPTVSTKKTTSKIGQAQPRDIIYINFVKLESPMLHAKFQDNRTSGSGNEDFYHIWAWRPSWSSALYHLYKLSFPLFKGDSHEI